MGDGIELACRLPPRKKICYFFAGAKTGRLKIPSGDTVSEFKNTVKARRFMNLSGENKMSLSDTSIRKLKPADKARKIADSDGLYLLLTPSGGKLWRMDYRFAEKRKTLSLGKYPAISLKEARDKCRDAREELAHGIDPGVRKAAVKNAEGQDANSFELIAREWLANSQDKWDPTHARRIEARLNTYLIPVLGSLSLTDITPRIVLTAIRAIEERGARETAHRALSVCGQIFRYAIATDRAERDVTADLRGALKPVKSTSFATITDPAAIGALLRSIDAYHGSLIVKAALKIAPYVFVRPSELRLAEWKEINFEENEWRIPASRMKMRELHIVPLSRQAAEIFRDLYQYTGNGELVFPGLRKRDKPISDATVLNALRSMGYGQEEMTVHGFRAMASTRLNEMGYNSDWIERQLAHGERNKVRASYNYAQYLKERRKMMQEWADYLDGLKNNA